MNQVKNPTPEFERASFNCEKSVLDEFRKLVAQKYGRLWGVLCREFTEALKDRAEKLRQELGNS